GPTAPMTAVTALIVAYAYESFQGDEVLREQFITLVLLMASAVLIIGGIIQLGKYIEVVPNVVILGFMNGIALLIWYDQIKKLFGIGAIKIMQGSIAVNILLAFTTLGLIYFIPWLLKKLKVPENVRVYLPGMLITIIVMTLITLALDLKVERVKLGTSVSSFGDFLDLAKSYFPTSQLFTLELMKTAIPFALQLALLAYLDSLLTSLVIDKMTHERTKQNKELVAQGLGNAVAALCQGIPGAQATIRSVLLIKEGAKTRLAGVLIGVFALLGILVFKDYLTMVAAAVFTGVLFKAGIDVFDRDFPKYYSKLNWKRVRKRNIQLLFIAYTTFVTVLLDLNIAVISGTVFYYIGKKFFNVDDAEPDLEKVSKEEREYITG
ncbi:MAG: SulP family inorganic anion transporter, partial [Bacteroidota bacterium]|nr:SulP family inorganic anion transporter [Bacteroidota bacterium]